MNNFLETVDKLKKSNVYYGDLSPIDILDLRKLKNKTWFEIEDIENLVPKTWFYIVKLKKGVGKTFQAFKMVENCINRNSKVVWLRWSKDELGSFMASVNTEKTWPCIVKTRGMLFDKNSKKRHVGLCSYVKGKGLTALRSLQFSDYDTVILDEYVPDPRDQNPEATKETIRAFIKMLLDIQREKPDLKVWLFGNANSYKDAFFDYFGLSYNVESAVDRKAGLLILNLRDHYIGSLESANAQRLLKFDDELADFIKFNKPLESDKNLLPKIVLRNARVHLQFVSYNYTGQVKTFKIYKHRKYRFIFIMEESDVLDLNYTSYTYELKANLLDKRIMRIDKDHIITAWIAAKLKFNKMLYVGSDTAKNFNMYFAPYSQEIIF